MSSGGGISRFAVRKQVSSNEDKSASTPNDNIQIAAATAPKFSFGLNENSDALSTTSDDEFGFLGGGGNSIGGDDFFMSDGGYNHERNAFEEANGDSTIAVENTPVQNGGIALFRGRTVTVPSATVPANINYHGNTCGENEAVPSASSSNALTPAPQVFNYNDKTLETDNNPLVSTHVVIAPQTTPDGRVLPMPLYPSVVTPHAPTTTRIEQYDSSEHRFVSTASDQYPASPSVGHTMQTMGPPPNRHSTTVTPAENNITTRVSSQTTDHMATKLFANEGLSFPSENNYITSNAAKQPFISNENVMEVNDRGATVDDTNNMNDENREDFHQRHQQFVTMIRDLHDMDKKFQDIMFDGSLHIDVATALLLQMKCDTYEVTDQILEQLDYANVALQEFLPSVVEQE